MWDPWADLVQSRERGQAFISERYFHLLRNYRRHGWIVLYLFGVSPVVCNSFLRGRNVTLPRLSKDTSYEPYATIAAHERPRLSQSQPGRALGVGQQPRRVRARPVARHHHAPRAVREVRREGGRRVPPAQRQHPADRERVLQLHPAEARGAFRRAAHQGAAARRRRIRRGARARRERIRSGGRQPEQAALPRGVPGAVPDEGLAADRRGRTGRARRESRDRRAARPRTRAHARARGPRRSHASTGRASCSIPCRASPRSSTAAMPRGPIRRRSRCRPPRSKTWR